MSLNIEQQLYKQMIIEQGHDTVFVRQCQKKLREKNIIIPPVLCGYKNELDEIEYHPDYNINKDIKNNMGTVWGR